MTNPGMMPQKMNPSLVKVDVEVVKKNPPETFSILAKLDREQEKREEREARREALAAALNGSPLVNDANREVKWQKRNAKKNQAIARINRKRRPKKR